MQSRFTERDTERFYDEEDSIYRAFWDREGSLHWGYFDEISGDDFLAASARLNEVMLTKSGIDSKSFVLDLGCGNGNTSTWLAEQRACHVTGIDLSGVRVNNANSAAAKLPTSIASLLTFKKGSATRLPFDDASFTHVWSQATIYHVHDKEAALAEAYRVLRPGGTFILDDLTKPRQPVSTQAQKHVYDRLLFDTPFSFSGYQSGLREHGLQVIEAVDLSGHLAKSYQKLGQMAKAAADNQHAELSALAEAYGHMVAAIEERYLGWALYICRK